MKVLLRRQSWAAVAIRRPTTVYAPFRSESDVSDELLSEHNNFPTWFANR